MSVARGSPMVTPASSAGSTTSLGTPTGCTASPLATPTTASCCSPYCCLLVGGWCLARRDHSVRMMARALLAPIGMLLAVAANQPVVHAVNESRPYNTLPHVLLLVHRSVDASFPSDHATMA